jgi:hypothetical protein
VFVSKSFVMYRFIGYLKIGVRLVTLNNGGTMHKLVELYYFRLFYKRQISQQKFIYFVHNMNQIHQLYLLPLYI